MSELDITVENQKRELRAMRRAYRAHQRFNEAAAEIREGQVCVSCKKRLPLGMFSASIVRGRKYLHHRCITCRARYYGNSKSCRAKRKLLDQLRSVPCTDCGNTFPPHTMVFDHVHGVKLFAVSTAWTGRSIESINTEAKKCDVVCANCMTQRRKRRRDRQLRRHFKLAELPPELRTQVDLAARLQQLHGAELVTS